MKKRRFLFLLLLFASLAGAGQGVRFEDQSRPFAEILEQAKREGKHVFIAAYSPTCHVCEHMNGKIYRSDSLASAYNDGRFINVKMDVDTGWGAEFARLHQIFGYPTYFFLDENGQPTHRAQGGKSVQKMLELAQAATDPAQQFFKLQARYRAGDRDPAMLKSLAFQAKDLLDYRLLEVVPPDYLATQEDWTTRENLDLILAAALSVEQPIYQYLVKNQGTFMAAFDEAKVKSKIDEVALNSLSMASYDHQARRFDFEKARQYGTDFGLPANLIDKTISIFRINQHLRAGENEAFFEAAIRHFEKHECFNTNLLNNFALAFYNNTDDPALLGHAAAWALRAAKLKDNYQLYDIAAAIYLKMGDRENAKAQALKALELAQKSNEAAEETRQLLKEIENLEK